MKAQLCPEGYWLFLSRNVPNTFGTVAFNSARSLPCGKRDFFCKLSPTKVILLS